MKKSNLITGIIYALIGIACLLMTLLPEIKSEEYLSGLSTTCITFGVLTICKYFYWNSPGNKERCIAILENEKIEMQDELKVKIRDKTGRYAYIFGIYIICLSIIAFSILGAFGIIDNVRMIVLCLGGYLVVQIIAEKVIFNHIVKKY